MNVNKYISNIITECFNYVDEKDNFIISSYMGNHSGTLEVNTDVLPVSILREITTSSELFTEIIEVGNRAMLVIHE